MSLTNHVQYQPRCTTSYKNLIAFCNETETSNRVVLCEEKEGGLKEHNLDVYDGGLMELRFLLFHQQTILVLLTETKIKGYSLDGKIVCDHERSIEGDLTEFQDRFVSCAATHEDCLYILSEKGSIYRLKDSGISLVKHVGSRGVVMSSSQQMMVVATEDMRIWGYNNESLVMLIKLPTKLPAYYINVAESMVVLGCISGELLITKFENKSLSLICRVQAHIGLMTCLQVVENTIYTGSDDGFANSFSFSSDKLSLLKSRNLNRIITGLFIYKGRCMCSIYESHELFPI